ncbi:MAG: hypothetical protein ACTSRS_17490 [Candidatus Helarchaeota archaeon]
MCQPTPEDVLDKVKNRRCCHTQNLSYVHNQSVKFTIENGEVFEEETYFHIQIICNICKKMLDEIVYRD